MMTTNDSATHSRCDMGYSMEIMREIWDDYTRGDCVEVGPDQDVLGMVEVRYKTDDGAIGERIAFPPERARLVAWAMLACAGELDATAANKEDEGK